MKSPDEEEPDLEQTADELSEDVQSLISEEEAEQLAIDYIGDGEVINIEKEVDEEAVSYWVTVETEEGPIELEVDGDDGSVTDLEDEEEDQPEEDDDYLEEEEDLETEEEDEIYIGGPGSEESPLGVILAIGIIAILIIAAVGAIVLIKDENGKDEEAVTDEFDGLGNDISSDDPLKASISELMPSEEWFELYIWGEGPGTTEGWSFTSFDEPLTPLPVVTGISKDCFILVHTGNGTGDPDGSDGKAEIYLGFQGEIMTDRGDEIAIFDDEENIIDFAGWGVSTNDTPRDGWSVGDYLPVPEDGSSLSIQGPDEGKNSYWTEGPPSPGSNNVISVDLSPDDDWVAHLVNGRPRTYYPEYDEDLDMWEPFTIEDPPAVNVTVQVPSGQPINETEIKAIQEYVDFTYKLMKKMGFTEAKSSGNDSSGRPTIKVVATEGGSYSGVCGFDGTIHVDLGSNKVTNKKLVEHEMTHNFQMNDDNGYRHIGPQSTRMVEEGMAEFIGRLSTMRNYNMTWSEVEKELQDSNNLNIYNHSSSTHINIFTDWWNASGRTYYAGPWEYYELAYLFYKFLYDKYGGSIIPAIYNNTKYGGGQNSIGRTAIEAATGEKLEDLIREFMLYRLENRFPQYKDDPGFEPLKPDRTANFTGSPVSTGNEWIERYGSRVNRFIMTGRNGIIEFKPGVPNSRWGITIIKVKPDGSRSYENHTLRSGQNGTWRIPPGYQEVMIIKTLLNGTTDYIYEWFNMTVKPDPVITPMGPPDNDHIMWNPPRNYFKWLLENLTRDMVIEILLDNTSTFSHPHYNWTLPWNVSSLPVPDNIGNGTWWWRIRWKTDTLNGPWTDPWNFTVWRDFDRPDIMWDPAPYRFENDTGSWLLLIPGMEFRIGPIEIPEGMDPGPGHGEIRFEGPDGLSSTTEFPMGEWTPLPEPDEDATGIRWRVVFDQFEPWPWFRDDIMWDPAPPSLKLEEPLPPARENENRTVQFGVNDTFHVDSFFDIFYQIDDDERLPYTIGPTLNRTEGGLMIYDLLLNLSDLREGSVKFNISVVDEQARRSDPLHFEMEVDRTAPEFEIETDPAGDPPAFNDSFSIYVWTDDITADHVTLEILDNEGGIHPIEMIVPLPPWTHAREWRGHFDLSEVMLPEGPITIHVVLIDDLGNRIDGYLEGYIDTIPPEITITDPPDGTVWFVGSEQRVAADTFEDQSVLQSVAEVRVVFRCMENFTEAFNVSLDWVEKGFFEGVVLIPSWADVSVPWRLEVYATDLAGNTGSSVKWIELAST